MRVVTISASYGAGGSVIAPAVAEQLDLPLVQRPITSAVAAHMAPALREAFEDERPEAGLSRMFGRTVRLLSQGTYFAVPLTEEEDEVRVQLEAAWEEAERRGGQVALAPGARFVVGDRPGALHVRLQGPAGRCVERAAQIEKVDLTTARARQRDTDDARSLYVRHVYRARWDDPALYHLVIDTTAFPLEASVDLIVRAARACFARAEEDAP
ncbi:MAG: cytidylate kinase-like family protein [Chloroflexi bacterium]|nr:cytidylate kinase-like family protein [Chloroflexota bacterium]